jgi:hypothetical protein
MIADELRSQADIFIDLTELQCKLGRDPSPARGDFPTVSLWTLRPVRFTGPIWIIFRRCVQQVAIFSTRPESFALSRCCATICAQINRRFIKTFANISRDLASFIRIR